MKKIIGITFLVVSVLVFAFSVSQLISSNIPKENARWTLTNNYSATLMDHKSPKEEIEQVRSYLLANPDYEQVIFNNDLYKMSQNNSEEMSKQTLSIATTLGYAFEADASYYGGHDYRNKAIYWLPNGVTLIQVTETHDYYYMVNVNKETKTTGSYIWTLEDGEGNTVFKVTDLTTSTQGKVTLEPGIYYLYDAYEDLRDVDLKLLLAKR